MTPADEMAIDLDCGELAPETLLAIANALSADIDALAIAWAEPQHLKKIGLRHLEAFRRIEQFLRAELPVVADRLVWPKYLPN